MRGGGFWAAGSRGKRSLPLRACDTRVRVFPPEAQRTYREAVEFVLFWVPVILIALAALAAVVSVRSSTLRITGEGVEIRNYPQPAKLFPLEQVERFEATPPVGNFSSLRPKTGELVLTSGTRVPVRRLTAPDAGTGVDALNERLASLRSER